MATPEASAPPEVLWAQRSSLSDPSKNFIHLTLSVPDVPEKDSKLDLKPTGFSFTGESTTLKRKFHVELEFYAEIDPAESKIHHTSKNIEMKLQKKELKEEYWPRLLKDAKKPHFLKTNFDKWADEDEQNDAPEEDLAQFGGADGGMGGMPGMGMPGMGGNDFSGIDFSKLAAGGGMPDMSGLEGLDAGAGDDEDEMPALEGKTADEDAQKA